MSQFFVDAVSTSVVSNGGRSLVLTLSSVFWILLPNDVLPWKLLATRKGGLMKCVRTLRAPGLLVDCWPSVVESLGATTVVVAGMTVLRLEHDWVSVEDFGLMQFVVVAGRCPLQTSRADCSICKLSTDT